MYETTLRHGIVALFGAQKLTPDGRQTLIQDERKNMAWIDDIRNSRSEASLQRMKPSRPRAQLQTLTLPN